MKKIFWKISRNILSFYGRQINSDLRLTVVVHRAVSVLGRFLRIGINVWYGVVLVGRVVVLVDGGGGGGVKCLLLVSRLRRRLARTVLARVTRVRDPVERHALHRSVDHGHQMSERGAQLLQVTGQHGWRVRGQAAPEPSARAHPVQREPVTGHVQQQVRVRRRFGLARRARCHQVS